MPEPWLTFAPVRLQLRPKGVAGDPQEQDPIFGGWGSCRSCGCSGYIKSGDGNTCRCGHHFSQHRLLRHWHFPDGLRMPYQFTERVSYRPIPEWVLLEDKVDLLRRRLQEKIADGVRYCIAVEYHADALGSPDPDWVGDQPRAIQETATELVRYVNLALWLARPTALSFDVVAHAVNHGTEWVTRQVADYDALCPLPEYENETHIVEDFEKARLLFKTLSGLSLYGTLRTAAQSTIRTLTEQGWTLRFLVLWLVVESLFGPEDAREITFRLSQRAALFLEKDRATARELFSRIKESYSWRSKIVHGLRLAKLTPEKSQELLLELEDLVRRSLLAILCDESMVATFDGRAREGYLDGLPFR